MYFNIGVGIVNNIPAAQSIITDGYVFEYT